MSFRGTMPWVSPGAVPLLAVPREYLEQGIILVETPAGMKSRPRPIGLGRLESCGRRAAGEPPGGRARRAGRRAARSGRPRLLVLGAGRPAGARRPSPEVPAPMPGIVREALLTTSVGRPGSDAQSPAAAGEPPSGRPGRAGPPRGLQPWCESVATAPTYRRSDRAARLAMPAHAGRQRDPVQHDRRGLPDGTGRRGRRVDSASRLAAAGPSVPVLHLGDRAAPGLAGARPRGRPAGRRTGRSGGLAVRSARPGEPAIGPCSPAASVPDRSNRLGQLNGQLEAAVPDEWSFAEWFSRWDSGPRPLVVDRLALGSAGLGPRSSCFPGRIARRPPRSGAGAAPSAGAGRRAVRRRLADHHGVRAAPLRAAGPVARLDRRVARLGLRPRPTGSRPWSAGAARSAPGPARPRTRRSSGAGPSRAGSPGGSRRPAGRETTPSSACWTPVAGP